MPTVDLKEVLRDPEAILNRGSHSVDPDTGLAPADGDFAQGVMAPHATRHDAWRADFQSPGDSTVIEHPDGSVKRIQVDIDP